MLDGRGSLAVLAFFVLVFELVEILRGRSTGVVGAETTPEPLPKRFWITLPDVLISGRLPSSGAVAVGSGAVDGTDTARG